MKKLSKQLQTKLRNYHNLNSKEKGSLLNELYHKRYYSWSQIARTGNTIGTYPKLYPEKIRRDALKEGIKSRNRSESQSVALQTGATKHPTKGVGHSGETKLKISQVVSERWENLSKKEKKRRSEIGKEVWNKKSKEEIEKMQRASGESVRKAAIFGSKIERFIFDKLVEQGYKIQYHKQHMIVNEKLEIDMMLPELNVALEIDGPSHFRPIWGQEALQKNIESDKQKNGLLLQMGMVVVRVRCGKQPTMAYKRKILNQILDTLKSIEKKFPKSGERLIYLGDK